MKRALLPMSLLAMVVLATVAGVMKSARELTGSSVVSPTDFELTSETRQGKHYVYVIPREKCAKQPVWDPATEPLPVAMAKLRESALKTVTLPAEVDASKITIGLVEFQRFPMNWPSGVKPPADLTGRWFCDFYVDIPSTGQSPSQSIMAVVLLDGEGVAGRGSP